MAKLPARLLRCDVRAARSQVVLLFIVGCAVAVAAVVVLARAMAPRDARSGRGAQRVATGSEPPALQPEAEATREHNAEVLFGRARIAAGIKSWRSARENLAALKESYSKTAFFASHRSETADLEKAIDEGLRQPPVVVEERPEMPPTLPVVPTPPVTPAPRTPEELHARLKERNPDYTGGGKFEVRDGRFVAASLRGCQVRDLSPLRGLPFQRLDCGGNPITSLAPLAGMPLEWLDCSGTQVLDLSPLKGVPLRELAVKGLALPDPSPLLVPPLSKLVLSPETVRGDLSVLRNHRRLALVGTDTLENAQTLAEVFWLELAARSGKPRPIASLEYKGHTKAVCSVALSPDGRWIASVGQDEKLRLWDGVAGWVGYIRDAHPLPPNRGLAFTRDGHCLLSLSFDGTIEVWKPSRGERLRALATQKRGLCAIAMCPSGKRFVTAGSYVPLQLWDATELRCLKTFEGPPRQIKSVAFSPDGHCIAAAGNELTLWDAAAGQCLKTLTGHRGELIAIAFSPDGKRVVAGGGDALYGWEIESGRLILSYPIKEGKTLCVAFTPDGKWLVSGGANGLLALRDSTTGEPQHILRGHKGWVTDLAVSVDGTRLASASADNTVRVWALGPPDLLELHLIEDKWRRQVFDYLSSLRMDFDFVDAPFRDVAASFSRRGNIPVFLGPDVPKGDPLRVTYRAEKMRFDGAFAEICRKLKLVEWPRDGALYVTRTGLDQRFRWPDKDLLALQWPPATESAARLKMMQNVTFDFAETPLVDVLAHLTKQTGIELAVHPEALRGPPPTVALRVENMRFDRALRWVGRMVDLTYLWRDGKLVMTPLEVAWKAARNLP